MSTTTYKTRSGRTVVAPQRYEYLWNTNKPVDKKELELAFRDDGYTIRVDENDEKDLDWNQVDADETESDNDVDFDEEYGSEVPEDDEDDWAEDEPSDDVLTDGDYESDEEEPYWKRKAVYRGRDIRELIGTAPTRVIPFDAARPIKDIRAEFFDKSDKTAEYVYKDDRYKPFAHMMCGEHRLYTRKFYPDVMNTKITYILDPPFVNPSTIRNLNRVNMTIHYKDGNKTEYSYQVIPKNTRFPKY